MRLVRFGARGKEKPGILTGGKTRLDLSGHFADWNSEFFAEHGLQKLAEIASALSGSLPLVPESERWAAPIARPGKVICIGLNYSDHAKESGMPVPAEPIVFLKASNTVVGPYDEVLIPRMSEKTDWEVELGVVIGREARYVESVEAAAAHIGGYCISHDVSERAFQLERGGQWTKGKSCDTFNPLGPWLATQEEIADPANLAMGLKVNGESKQQRQYLDDDLQSRLPDSLPFAVHDSGARGFDFNGNAAGGGSGVQTSRNISRPAMLWIWRSMDWAVSGRSLPTPEELSAVQQRGVRLRARRQSGGAQALL